MHREGLKGFKAYLMTCMCMFLANTTDASENAVQALITSRLDFCNSLLYCEGLYKHNYDIDL